MRQIVPDDFKLLPVTFNQFKKKLKFQFVTVSKPNRLLSISTQPVLVTCRYLVLMQSSTVISLLCLFVLKHLSERMTTFLFLHHVGLTGGGRI